MTEPEFELNEDDEISKIKKWAEDEIMKIQCKVIHDIIEREKKDDQL